MPAKLKPEPILDTILRELHARKGRRVGNWPDIARESGVPYDTLTKIAQGRSEPGIRTAQKLLDYFAAHPAEQNNPACIP